MILDPSRHFRVDLVAIVDIVDRLDIVDIVDKVDIVDIVVFWTQFKMWTWTLLDPVKAYTVHMVDIDDMVMEDNGDEVDYVDLVDNTRIVDMLSNNE